MRTPDPSPNSRWYEVEHPTLIRRRTHSSEVASRRRNGALTFLGFVCCGSLVVACNARRVQRLFPAVSGLYPRPPETVRRGVDGSGLATDRDVTYSRA